MSPQLGRTIGVMIMVSEGALTRLATVCALFVFTAIAAGQIFALPPEHQTVRRSSGLIPDVSLEVTVRQEEDGVLSKGFIVWQLVCWSQECSLTDIVFDECRKLAGARPTSMFKVEQYSTNDGTLNVTALGDNITATVKAHQFGAATIVLSFGYLRRSGDILSSTLTSFSGGFIKDSAILKRVINVKYVPLQGRFAEVSIECPLNVPGVWTSSEIPTSKGDPPNKRVQQAHGSP